MMKGKPRTVFLIVLMGSAAILFSPGLFKTVSPASKRFLEIEERKAASGNHYTIFYKNDCLATYEVQRPHRDEKSIVLCIPAAFTDLKTGAIDGACISKGSRCSEKASRSLDGALLIDNDSLAIMRTSNGKMLTDSLLDSLAKRKASLLQQILLLYEGQALSFSDKKRFQRRAVVQLADKRWAVIESLETMTQEAFAKDLASLGAYNAIYTDMGSFDEGWYRWPSTGKLKKLGQLMNETSQQTNWLIFKTQ